MNNKSTDSCNPFLANGGRPLAGRTALVTGAGQNIGRGIALMLASAGANIVVNGRTNRAAIDDVAAEVRASGVEALPVLADVGDPKAVEQMVKESIGQFGSIDVLICNAGVRPKGSIVDIAVEDWQRAINTNLSGAFYLARNVLPRMQQRGWGRLIHIAGQDGWRGYPNRAPTVATKAAVFALAKTIALEYGPFGITANAVSPGMIETRRSEKDYPDLLKTYEERKGRVPMRRLGTPADIAAACLYLCSEAGSYVTGQVLHVNGGDFMY